MTFEDIYNKIETLEKNNKELKQILLEFIKKYKDYVPYQWHWLVPLIKKLETDFEFVEGVGNVHKNLKGKFSWFDQCLKEREKKLKMIKDEENNFK